METKVPPTSTASVAQAAPLPSVSPGRRVWLRFRASRRGYWSLLIFCVLFVLSLGAELISNDRPLLARYNGQLMFPLVRDYSETAFGGDFDTPADYLDPFIQQQFRKEGNWAIYPINHYRYDTLNYFAKAPNPAPPTGDNWLGTDDRGRDVVARLLYGFRVSILFGLALTITGVALGVLTGVLSGLFGVGGGLVIVPTLYFLWNHDPELGPHVMHFAVATSLACIVVTSVTSSWTHWRARRLQFDRLPWLAIAVSVGSVSAVTLANWTSSQWLKLGFGLFALASCVSLLRKRVSTDAKPVPATRELLGAGALIVPALVLFLGLTQVDAEATSLLALVPVAVSYSGRWR